MAQEIELSFAVRRETMPDISRVPYVDIEQVYLTPFPPSDDYPEVASGEWRLRKEWSPVTDESVRTTAKFGDKASGSRIEVEALLLAGDFGTNEADIAVHGLGIVRKRRYQLADDIVVDRFDPALHGDLWLAEREFKDHDEARSWQPPEWCKPLPGVPSNRKLAVALPQSTHTRIGIQTDQVLDEVRQFRRKHNEALITISGMSGSGKSTLARHIANELGANHIEADNFHIGCQALRERHGDINHDLPVSYDYPKVAEAAGKLLGRQSTEMPVYDFASGEPLEYLTRMEPSKQPVVVVDGLYAKLTSDYLRQADNDISVLNILMNTPLYVCVLRRLIRDAVGKPSSDSIEREVSMTPEEVMEYLMAVAIPSFHENTPAESQFELLAL